MNKSAARAETTVQKESSIVLNKKGVTFMKWLQKLGKALMLPVACLPICGILMGIGYLLCPSTMQGGDVVGFAETLGFFLVKAGAA